MTVYNGYSETNSEAFPVAQMVEHGASNAKIDHGFDSQGKQELVNCKTVT